MQVVSTTVSTRGAGEGDECWRLTVRNEAINECT